MVAIADPRGRQGGYYGMYYCEKKIEYHLLTNRYSMHFQAVDMVVMDMAAVITTVVIIVVMAVAITTVDIIVDMVAAVTTAVNTVFNFIYFLTLIEGISVLAGRSFACVNCQFLHNNGNSKHAAGNCKNPLTHHFPFPSVVSDEFMKILMLNSNYRTRTRARTSRIKTYISVVNKPMMAFDNIFLTLKKLFT